MHLHKLSHYKHAAELLKLAKESRINIKHVLYNEKKYQFMNIKSLFALVSKALAHWDIIELLINETKILINEPRFNIWHVRILITELIFGTQVIDDQNDFGYTILQYESQFRELFSKQDIQKALASNNNVDIKVRYIKVNPIKETVDSIIKIFIEEGWQQISTPDSYQEFLDQLRGLEPHSYVFLQDFHIPEVLVFPPGTELHSHDLYKNGSFYFMDKSSCLAPYLLRPRQDSSLLDMCAAPGLKTIQLASLAQSGKVYAVEKNDERFQSLKDMVSLSGANNISLIHQDVTELQTDQYDDVEYILLDPSCSGSGMQRRQPLVKDNEVSCDKRRLYKLAGFQLTLLRFALTRFPAAKRIVYSTCSLNEEENEEVVQAALNSMYHNFKVTSAGKKISQWINFGSQKYSFGQKCIYSRPETDLTNGFFIAVFKRKKCHISKDLPTFDVNPDGFCSDTKKIIKFSENMDCSVPANEVHNQYDSCYSNCSNTVYNNDNKTSIKRSQPKEDFYETNEDQRDKFSLPKKVKRGAKYDLSNKVLAKKFAQKSKTECGMNTSNKLLTTSRKKRLRQQKRKLKKVQKNNNIKTNKKTIVNNQNLNSHSKCDVIKEKMKNNTQNPNETVKTISKAKLRYKRLKQLKLNKNYSKMKTCTSTNGNTKEASKHLK